MAWSYTQSTALSINAEFFGMTTDEYLEINGMTEDDMEDEYMNALKSEMVMWAIVEKEGLATR